MADDLPRRRWQLERRRWPQSQGRPQGQARRQAEGGLIHGTTWNRSARGGQSRDGRDPYPRSEEERIEALEAQIAALKARAAAKKVKKDPSLRHISAALRSVDRALAESGDVATRMSLSEIRTSLSACLSLNGVEAKSGGNGTLVPQRRRAVGAVDAEGLLAFIQAHPGSRGEQIAAELGIDTKAVRPVMHRLIDENK